MNKARTALASARILLEAGDTDGATNRAYYAMFDAAIAALAWADPDIGHDPPRTHGGLIARFGRRLVQTGVLSAAYGRAFNRVQELRLTADYLAAPVTSEKAAWAIGEAENFVAAIALAQSGPSPPTG
ncbi:MAG: HEPN domain-containing protein [Rhodospirillales bacterium]|nr:HEPN domain-containing protein [Rhodospirillales bacterium]